MISLMGRLETQLQLRLEINTLRETQLLVTLAHATSSQSEMLHFEIERGGCINYRCSGPSPVLWHT
jgi:hypothetical protein